MAHGHDAVQEKKSQRAQQTLHSKSSSARCPGVSKSGMGEQAHRKVRVIRGTPAKTWRSTKECATGANVEMRNVCSIKAGERDTEEEIQWSGLGGEGQKGGKNKRGGGG